MYERIKEIVRERLSDKRWDHTLRVVETAVSLADVYGQDVEKAKIAAILHDVAREEAIDEVLAKLSKEKVEITELERNCPQLLHAKLGVVYARELFQIDDLDTLNAIRYHTTGRENMSMLEKIVFMADYIEPGRKFPGVEEIRKMTYNDMDAGLEMALKEMILHLVEKGRPIHPDSILAYNAILAENQTGGLQEQS